MSSAGHHFNPKCLAIALFAACLPLIAANDTVAIITDPPGAQVEINGKLIGTTPLRWKIGNWALNPRKRWIGSKHLNEPLTMTVIQDGYIPKTIRLTGDPLQWTSLDRSNRFIYYVVQSTEYHLKLDKV